MIFWPARLCAFPGEMCVCVCVCVCERESERTESHSFVLTYRTRHAIESRAFVSIKLPDKRTRHRVHSLLPSRYASSRSPRYRWRLSILPFRCLHKIIAFLVPSTSLLWFLGRNFLHAAHRLFSTFGITDITVALPLIFHCKYYKSLSLVHVSS